MLVYQRVNHPSPFLPTGHHRGHKPIQPAVAVKDGHGTAHVHHEGQALGQGLEETSGAPWIPWINGKSRILKWRYVSTI